MSGRLVPDRPSRAPGNRPLPGTGPFWFREHRLVAPPGATLHDSTARA